MSHHFLIGAVSFGGGAITGAFIVIHIVRAFTCASVAEKGKE